MFCRAVGSHHQELQGAFRGDDQPPLLHRQASHLEVPMLIFLRRRSVGFINAAKRGVIGQLLVAAELATPPARLRWLDRLEALTKLDIYPGFPASPRVLSEPLRTARRCGVDSAGTIRDGD